MRGRDFRPPPKPRVPLPSTRLQAIRRTARELERYAWPRLEMSLLVGVTGLAGLLSSVLLLALGVDQMWQRYPLAVAIAYLVFLLELWLWMHTRSDDSSGPDLSLDLNLWPTGGGTEPPAPLGGGGSFSGAGASGGWDDVGSTGDSPGDAASSLLEPVGGIADAGDGEGCAFVVVLLLVAALVASLLAGAVYIVWGAPMLMAELLVDGVLSFGLYRNLRRQEREFWLFTALRRTGLVFLLVAFILSLVGAALAHQVPGARTLGQAIDGAKAMKEGRR